MGKNSGIYGFQKHGLCKVTEIGKGGGLTQLGERVLRFCCRNFAMDLIFDRIELVNGLDRPTEEQFAECTAAGFSEQPTFPQLKTTWFHALANAEGDLDKLGFTALTRGRGYMIDCRNQLFDGLYHYAYVINLDTEKLEVWIGDRLKPYYPLMISEFPIKEIAAGGPSGISGFVRKMKAAEKQDKEGE